MSISDLSCSFCFNCCSTPANCTSCWVNWLVSSGESGFWFCSCVVSSVRKVWKLPASVAPVDDPSEFDEDDEEDVCVVPETTAGAVAAFVVVMVEYSSHSDVDAAARSEHAAVAAPDGRSSNGVVLADDQPAGIAAIVVVLAGLLAR